MEGREGEQRAEERVAYLIESLDAGASFAWSAPE